MTSYVFSLPEQPAARVVSSEDRFPIRRIFCVGRNYEAHAKEMGVEADREAPFYFTKSACAFQDAGADLKTSQPYPPGTENYHHEVELVVALGGEGFRVPVEEALNLVWGYASGLDMTRRDLQIAERKKQRPWDLGKDVENSAVMGEISPVSSVGHIKEGRVHLSVNGELRQDQDVKDMIWSVPELISHLSGYYHLMPGDVIYTGTPAGVGPVVVGDVLEGGVEGLSPISLTLISPDVGA